MREMAAASIRRGKGLQAAIALDKK